MRDKQNPNNVVGTVECTKCGRPWTGMFEGRQQDAPCPDCVRQDATLVKGHPDVTINPSNS